MSDYVNDALLGASPYKKQADESKKLVSKWERTGLLDGIVCIFPFIYDGVTYNTCTWAGNTKAWCATSVDDEGNYHGWGNCRPNCPGSNQPGK